MQVDEIPEELLPEPFNRKELDVHSNMKTPTSSFPIKTSTVALTALQSAVSETCIRDDEIAEGTEQDLNSNINNSPNMSFPLGTSIEAHRKQQPVVASHLSRSFHKRFSQKVISHEVQNYPLNLSKTDLQSSVLPVPESPLNKSSSKEKSSSAAGTPSPSKLSFESTSNEKCLAVHASPAHLPQSCPPATPSKEIDAMNNENGSPAEIANIHSTPAKHVLTPAGLMNVTPTLYPPKRCYMSPEDDSTSSPNKLIRRPPRSRSLKFDTPIKNGNIGDEMDDTGGVSVDNDVFDILPENILQSVSPIVNSLCFHPYQAWFYVLFKTIYKLSFFFLLVLFDCNNQHINFILLQTEIKSRIGYQCIVIMFAFILALLVYNMNIPKYLFGGEHIEPGQRHKSLF